EQNATSLKRKRRKSCSFACASGLWRAGYPRLLLLRANLVGDLGKNIATLGLQLVLVQSVNTQNAVLVGQHHRGVGLLIEMILLHVVLAGQGQHDILER